MSFKNHQWEVNEDGLDSCGDAPHYEVDAKRLSETTDRLGILYYNWPVHMAEKIWVDIEAFIEAFTKALDIHKGVYPYPKDEEMLERSIVKARKEARDR